MKWLSRILTKLFSFPLLYRWLRRQGYVNEGEKEKFKLFFNTFLKTFLETDFGMLFHDSAVHYVLGKSGVTKVTERFRRPEGLKRGSRIRIGSMPRRIGRKRR